MTDKMRLLAISNHLQIYGDKTGGKIMLVNMNENPLFKRIMIDTAEILTVKNLLDSLEVESRQGKTDTDNLEK